MSRDEPFNWDEFHSVSEKVLNEKVSKHTVPLYRYIDNRVALWGTGVFIKFHNFYMILTASHVVDDKKSLYIYTVDGLKQIDGIIHCSNEKIDDAAIIVVTDRLGRLIAQSRVPLMYDFIISLPDTRDLPYSFYGYPVLKSKSKDNVLSSAAVSHAMYLSNPKNYRANRRDPDSHYIFNVWKPRAIDGGEISNEDAKFLKSPYGISGSGIWSIIYNKVGDEIVSKYALVGILNEFTSRPPLVFIGTKSNIYLANMHRAVYMYMLAQMT